MIRLIALPLIMVALASPAIAQPRGYLDVNYIEVNSDQIGRTDILTPQRIMATGLRTVSYPELETARAAQFNMGVRLFRHFGVGVRFAAIKHESTTQFTVDKPAVAIVSSTLERRHRTIDLSAVYFVSASEAWTARIFGGPSFYKINEENDFLGPHLEFEDGFGDVRVFPIEESAVGFHLGGDVAYFFTRHVGIGGVVSVGRGRVAVVNQFEPGRPPTLQKVELDAGHVLFGGGLRFRF
jgi:hypothetical protein